MRRSWILAVVTATVAASCAGSVQVTGNSDESSARQAERLAQILQGGVSYDYDPFDSPQAQRDAADLVVVGTIAKSVFGRTLPYGRSGPQTNLVIEVQDVIRGKVTGDVVYVEVPIQAEDGAVSIDSDAFSGRLLLFLDDRTDIRSADGEQGRPEGERIYAPFVQGVILEADASWVSGLVDSADWHSQWRDLSTFEDLIAALKR